MTNEGFREYVNGNMLFWAANVKSPEGYKGIYCVLSTYIILPLIVDKWLGSINSYMNWNERLFVCLTIESL